MVDLKWTAEWEMLHAFGMDDPIEVVITLLLNNAVVIVWTSRDKNLIRRIEMHGESEVSEFVAAKFMDLFTHKVYDHE